MKNSNVKKILILKSNRGDFEKYYIEHMQAENIKTAAIHKYDSGIMWKITWIWREILKLPYSYIWFGEWKKELSEYDEIIVFDNNLNWNILEYIYKKNHKARIIAWYWNHIKKEKQRIPKKYRHMCEQWSFDKDDCKKYNMNYNIQFYEGTEREQGSSITYSAIFVGKDKGRYEKITEIKNFFQQNGFVVYINVVRDKLNLWDGILNNIFFKVNKKCHRKKYSRPISYYQLINKIESSKCIIDIPQEGQGGMTARVLEALFFHKKLITTDKNVTDYEWYCKENILVWNNAQTKESIASFLALPYVRIDEVQKQYSFKQWVNNFDKD